MWNIEESALASESHLPWSHVSAEYSGPLPWLFHNRWQAGSLPPCSTAAAMSSGVLASPTLAVSACGVEAAHRLLTPCWCTPACILPGKTLSLPPVSQVQALCP